MACSSAAELWSGISLTLPELTRGRAQRIRVCTDLFSSTAVSAPQPRPLVRVISALIDVPARAAGMPDGLRQRRTYLPIEGLKCLGPDLNRAGVLPVELPQRGDDVLQP